MLVSEKKKEKNPQTPQEVAMVSQSWTDIVYMVGPCCYSTVGQEIQIVGLFWLGNSSKKVIYKL